MAKKPKSVGGAFASWGGSPSANLVGMAWLIRGQAVVRIWGDGLTEYKATLAGWEPQEWTPLPVNPNAPLGTAMVAITEGHLQTSDIYRLWADGTVDNIEFESSKSVVFPNADGWTSVPNLVAQAQEHQP